MIRILDRYIGRDFLKLFGLALTVLVALALLVNLFEQLHRYVVWGASSADIISYYAYTVPREMLRVAPIACLVASFFTVGRLSRTHEFLSIQMARLHPLRAVLPLILLSLAITACLGVIQEEIAPRANDTAFRIWQHRIKKSSAFHRTRSQDIWYLAGSDRILHIDSLDAGKGEMQEVSLFEFSPDLVLLKRTEAARGRWEEGRWILSGARIHHFSGGGLDVGVTEVAEMPMQLKATPVDLARIEKNVEEMSYKELKRYIRRLTRSGVDAQRHVADLLAKPAMLAVNFIMALLGIVFAFRVGRQGLFVHVGTCFAAAFLYWLLFSIALPLGRNNVLPPLLAVWLPNAVFGGFALAAMLRVHPRA